MPILMRPPLMALLGLGTLAILLTANVWATETAVDAVAGPADFADHSLAACVNKSVIKAGVDTAKELTKLTCHAMSISDATGVNSLTNLKQLSLFGNRLTTIELKGLSGLESLNLANNALTDIDLSPAPDLKTLYLFGNQLKQLNLESLKQLVKVKAEKNQLLVVTFADHSALQKVYLFNNKMVDIVIDTLPALKFIDVRSNPMPDEVYDYLDEFRGVKASHDGNTEDWK